MFRSDTSCVTGFRWVAAADDDDADDEDEDNDERRQVKFKSFNDIAHI